VRLAGGLLVAVVLLGAGCGSRSQTARPGNPPPDLLAVGDTVGRAPDTTFAVGEGKRRVVLVAAKGKSGERCVSATSHVSRTPVHCLGPGLPDPVVVFVGFGGKVNGHAESAPVIGFARADVVRVSITMQNDRSLTPKLKRWPGFKWSGFALEPGAGGESVTDLLGTREPNQPVELFAYDAEGRKLMDLDLAGVSWNAETPQDALGRDSPADVQAKLIALRDPLVRRLLAGRKYWLGAPAAWLDCDNSSIGAFFEVYVPEPFAYEGDLPFVDFNRKSGKPYLEGVLHLAVSNAHLIYLHVDIHRRHVVSIDPTGDDVHVEEYRVVKEPPMKPDHVDCEGNPEGD